MEIDADGDRSAELWGYFQVRSDPSQNPQPPGPLIDAKLTEKPCDHGLLDGAELNTLPLVDSSKGPS